MIIYGETNLWEMIRHCCDEKAYRDPQECFWSAQSVCFGTSSRILFFLLSMTPPSHKQAAGFAYFFSFFHLLKHVHFHFKHVREMASVSAAVTAFHRRAGDVCLWDTHKIDLATDTTTQSVLQGTAAPEGVPKSQKQSVSKSDKL